MRTSVLLFVRGSNKRRNGMVGEWEIRNATYLVGSSLGLLSRFGPERMERRNEIHGSLYVLILSSYQYIGMLFYLLNVVGLSLFMYPPR